MIRGIKSLCSYAHEPANGLLKTTKIFKTQSVIWKMACFVVCLNEQKMVGSPQEENWLAFYWIKVPKQGLPDNFPGANQQISLGCWVVVRMGEERKRNLHMQEDPNNAGRSLSENICWISGWLGKLLRLSELQIPYLFIYCKIIFEKQMFVENTF